ncbi:hypothetical protein P10VF_230 [Rhizobium phage vB_RleM_P10VF]|uniref:Uncharacterized protein n=2 Tax=Innesvirus TaxID=3044739 RepID=A0A076YIY9_9CAUD|nr:hypothetical protein P10VF_230 [Rhizobium phage vB_RleM_P10VF]YP_010662152.1 hypothetical protein PP938_gp002 [Rhizobium phage AF3]AIK68443.1 hypothetical protein P10VF_230 [Rhizobium phage vB_RleM_P10VF]QNH71557.1 hypothetical protein AF3_002 [Rhizobium phage AF3]
MPITNIMTFQLGFRKKSEPEGEIELMEFSVYYDRNQYDDPKDVAIDHHSTKLADHTDFKDLVPIFRTFRCLNDRVPSDLGMR